MTGRRFFWIVTSLPRATKRKLQKHMYNAQKPERNNSITKTQFRAAYSMARRHAVTMGGIGLDWTTPANVAGACLSMRGQKDLRCSGTAWKLAAIREADIAI